MSVLMLCLQALLHQAARLYGCLQIKQPILFFLLAVYVVAQQLHVVSLQDSTHLPSGNVSAWDFAERNGQQC